MLFTYTGVCVGGGGGSQIYEMRSKWLQRQHKISQESRRAGNYLPFM